jgi:hypothetical protein
MPKSSIPTAIQPAMVRYIKLGREGGWEQECLKKGIVRFGFGSASDERFPLCQNGRWKDLAKSFLAEGKDKSTATRFTNESRIFFEDQGNTLWITFIGEHLCWGFLEPGMAKKHEDGKGVWRAISGKWKQSDMFGEPLTKEKLSGALTKLASYRGTSCGVDVADYVVRRINAQKTPQVERAIAAMKALKQAIGEMIQLLGPKDFETLVDLIFSISGWRRQGIVGKTQKTLDLDLLLPSTGERAFVQVKSQATMGDFENYIAKFNELGIFDRMFFVLHSGTIESNDERVTVIGREKLSEMALDAGLGTWLLRKVS